MNLGIDLEGGKGMGRIGKPKESGKYDSVSHRMSPVNVIPDDAPDAVLACPEYLDTYAREFYIEHASRMRDANLLHERSRHFFIILANAWATWRGFLDIRKELENMAAKSKKPLWAGWLKKNGGINPVINKIRDAEHHFRICAKEFGFTPASQGSVSASMGEVENDYDDFMD